MIDRLNVNNKVEVIRIMLISKNEMNEMVMNRMVTRYKNVNDIYILNWLDQINYDIDNQIKQLVK